MISVKEIVGAIFLVTALWWRFVLQQVTADTSMMTIACQRARDAPMPGRKLFQLFFFFFVCVASGGASVASASSGHPEAAVGALAGHIFEARLSYEIKVAKRRKSTVSLAHCRVWKSDFAALRVTGPVWWIWYRET